MTYLNVFTEVPILLKVVILLVAWCIALIVVVKSSAETDPDTAIIHRFVLKPDYVRLPTNTIQYLTEIDLREYYGLKEGEYILFHNKYTYEVGDILLPPLEDGNYEEFMEESVALFYMQQQSKLQWN